jgi:hypothetical protein
VFNSGHRKGGKITRARGPDDVRVYSTHAPMVIAAQLSKIGNLPLSISGRSITIHLQRHDGTRPLKRFDVADKDAIDILNTIYRLIWQWAHSATLARDPALPAELKNRPADNWRVLISIADTFGPAWGEKARAAGVAFARAHNDEYIGAVLLAAIRDGFNAHNVDRFFSKVLVDLLNDQDDAPWSEWTGLHGDQSPRKLSQNELAKALRTFGIKPRSVWPVQRDARSKSSKGYYRSQFTQAWASYCDDEADTPAQPSQCQVLAS